MLEGFNWEKVFQKTRAPQKQLIYISLKQGLFSLIIFLKRGDCYELQKSVAFTAQVILKHLFQMNLKHWHLLLNRHTIILNISKTPKQRDISVQIVAELFLMAIKQCPTAIFSEDKITDYSISTELQIQYNICISFH